MSRRGWFVETGDDAGEEHFSVLEIATPEVVALLSASILFVQVPHPQSSFPRAVDGNATPSIISVVVTVCCGAAAHSPKHFVCSILGLLCSVPLPLTPPVPIFVVILKGR